MLGGVLGGTWPFQILFLLIAIGALLEFLTIVLGNTANAWVKAMGVLLGISPVLTYMVHLNVTEASKPLLLFPAVLPALLIALLLTRTKDIFQQASYVMTGMFYIGIPVSLLMILAHFGEHYHWELPMGLLLLVWSSDTFAYVSGKFLGKTPLFPSVSPNKTWEGTVGGALGCIIVGWGLHHFWQLDHFPAYWWIWAAAITAVTAPLGDLVESQLKRSHDIKDSGQLLPGHGGVLDRFDAFLFILPFIAVAWWFLQ